MASLIGQSFGRYHILEQLGEGGMATVYKAYDTRLDRNVAIKVILPQKQHSEKFLKRFEREAKALAQLSHPNIVGVIDYGEEQGIPFLVMEYIPGGTLKQKVGKPIPWQEAAHLLAPIARALGYAHQRKIIHRDVKPSNILITESGEPMLSDFGIAKMLEAEETMDLTGTGVGVGTPEYMAPEQGLSKPVDARVDIYALGVVFYEMVTGRKPYQADTPLAVLLKSASEPLPRPRDLVREMPENVERVLLKALAKRPGDRFQDMIEFANVLEKLGQGSKVSVGKVSKITDVKAKRVPVLVGALSGFGVVVIGTLIVWELLNLGQRGTGPLAPLATATLTPFPTYTSTPTKTATLNPTTTPTKMQTPTWIPLITTSSSCIPNDWSVIGSGSGQWNCDGNIIQAHSSRGDSILVSDAMYSDVIITATVSTRNREASLAIRMKDAGNGYIIIFLPDGIAWNNGVGGIWIVERTNYEESILDYYHNQDFTVIGQSVKISIAAIGSSLKVSLNDKLVLLVNDTTYVSGKIGLRINGDASLPCDSTFEDLVVLSP